ncbi:MAG: SH3 domain-containing protein [Bacteroidia bacterium]|nr:SH3 domain-containing protein [Bacteroidia bacterium]
MTKTKYYILTLLIFCSISVLAQNGPSIIKDSDGFTNVRSGPGTHFDVIDTLFKEDFFYFKFENNSDWAKVTAWKGRQIEGFIHKSRIQEVKNLNDKSLKEIIIKVLERQRTLADSFRAAWKAKDSLSYRTTIRELENFNDTKYDPILEVIPEYFCSTNDDEIINKFFATMWSDKGSANEMPSFSIGDCFVCNPDLVIKLLDKITDNEQKKLIIGHIEWGLINRYDVDEEGNSEDKKYNKLIEILKKASL